MSDATSKKFKMKISFRGSFQNAKRGASKDTKGYLGFYHDVLLSLLKGDGTVEEARELFADYEGEPYEGGHIIISKPSRSTAADAADSAKG